MAVEHKIMSIALCFVILHYPDFVKNGPFSRDVSLKKNSNVCDHILLHDGFHIFSCRRAFLTQGSEDLEVSTPTGTPDAFCLSRTNLANSREVIMLSLSRVNIKSCRYISVSTQYLLVSIRLISEVIWEEK